MRILSTSNRISSFVHQDFKRCMSVQAKVIDVQNKNRFQNTSSSFSQEFENALPYESIPSSGVIGNVMAYLPGGKYYKKQNSDILKLLRAEHGDIVKIPGMFGKPEVVITFNPLDYEKVFRTDGLWPSRIQMQSVQYFRGVEQKNFYKPSAGVVIDEGEVWSKTRSTLNPILMQPKNVAQYIPAIDGVTNELMEKIFKMRNSNTLEVPANFNYDLQLWTLEATGVIALDTHFGLISGKIKNPNVDKLIKNMNEFFHLLWKLEMQPNLSYLVKTPNFRRMMKIQHEIQEITGQFVDETINKMERDSNLELQGNSVLAKLLKLDRNIAIVMATDMLMFGVDTTTSAVLTSLIHFAQNRDKQGILREEIRKILPNKDTPLNKENMNNLPYLRACIKEALRLNPVTMGNTRILRQDLALSGYRVPKGTNVLMASQIIQNEDKYFPKSDKFIPERWLRNSSSEEDAFNSACPSAKSTNPFVYLPFGFGVRMCIGKRFALMETEVALARIIRHFDVELNYPIRYTSNVINFPEGDFKFKFTDVSN